MSKRRKCKKIRENNKLKNFFKLILINMIWINWIKIKKWKGFTSRFYLNINKSIAGLRVIIGWANQNRIRKGVNLIFDFKFYYIF